MRSHLIEFHAGWKLWRWTWIRAAGFPARRVLDLAGLDAAAAADELHAQEVEAAALRASAIARLWQLSHEGGELARAAIGAVQQLERQRLPRKDDRLEAEVEPLFALRGLDATMTRQRERLDQVYEAALARIAKQLLEVAVDPWFREALLWQNRRALHTGVDWLLAHPQATNSDARQKQRLIASYLQRYCVKNDTIGFFGPICWGEVSDSSQLEVTPAGGLRDRQVALEDWAIDALADTIMTDEVRPFVAPRLLPSVGVAGTTLRYGFDRTATIALAIAQLLVACDGETPAIVIARALVRDGHADTEAEVYELLDELAARKLVLWKLEPSALTHPERELRRLLERIEIPAVRERALAPLVRLEAARDKVAAAVGDPARLEPALVELDATFRDITGQDATRHSGEMYAARTLVYEDCVGELSLTVGRPILDRLAPVLPLVAHSARWFTYEIATRYRAQLLASFRKLAQGSTEPIHYLRLWPEIQHLLPEDRRPGVVGVEALEELDRRWSEILQLDMSQRRVEIPAAQIADRVMDLFAAPGPGWPGARHISPDIMVAAKSVDAVANGDFTLVLGEVHIVNSLLARLLVPHGPNADADSLMRAYESDLPNPRLLTTEVRRYVNRALNAAWSLRDFEIELGVSRSWRPRDRVLRVADLVVEDVGHTLAVRELASGRTFDILELLETYLAVMAGNHFRPVQRGPHVPRVSIEGVVLAREQWRFAPADLGAWIGERRGARQFAAIRNWARDLGLPRWVFAKIPEEIKPTYLDLASPIYVEMFAGMARKASSLTVTEMLPDVEDTWIPDASGRTYTGEFRMVAVDPIQWVPPR